MQMQKSALAPTLIYTIVSVNLSPHSGSLSVVHNNPLAAIQLLSSLQTVSKENIWAGQYDTFNTLHTSEAQATLCSIFQEIWDVFPRCRNLLKCVYEISVCA